MVGWRPQTPGPLSRTRTVTPRPGIGRAGGARGAALGPSQAPETGQEISDDALSHPRLLRHTSFHPRAVAGDPGLSEGNCGTCTSRSPADTPRNRRVLCPLPSTEQHLHPGKSSKPSIDAIVRSCHRQVRLVQTCERRFGHTGQEAWSPPTHSATCTKNNRNPQSAGGWGLHYNVSSRNEPSEASPGPEALPGVSGPRVDTTQAL